MIMSYEQSPETKELALALLECQREFPSIVKGNDNPFFDSKYADINSVLAVVRPILNKHGILLEQPISGYENKTVYVTMQLHHAESDQWKRTTGGIAVAKEDPQAGGSAITYLRRYLLVSMLGLEQVDDDANSQTYVITNKQGVCVIGRDDRPRPLNQMDETDLKRVLACPQYKAAHNKARELLENVGKANQTKGRKAAEAV